MLLQNCPPFLFAASKLRSRLILCQQAEITHLGQVLYESALQKRLLNKVPGSAQVLPDCNG